MAEPTKRYTAFVKAGTLTRPAETMCMRCFKSALWEGITYFVNMNGVRPHGKVKGCRECHVWFYFNNAGDLIKTTGTGAPKEQT